MRSLDDLRRTLLRIDRRGYKAYQEIEGRYQGNAYLLMIDQVQGDPFAAPSRVRVLLSQDQAGFPPELYPTTPRRIALQDYLIRRFAEAIHAIVEGSRGSGRSGFIGIDCGGQEVLERTACLVSEQGVEVRFVMGLPAAGRTILAHEAIAMCFENLPRIVDESLRYSRLEPRSLRRHLEVVEDQAALRAQLREQGLVAFLGNGAILPRRSGVDDRPLRGDGPMVIPLQAPSELEVTLHAPHAGAVRGMGLPAGVTLIVGGGFHGKSTLLRALERGVYPHIPGDGREQVVTLSTAVKIRAEDGRSVAGVDISPFINHLPFGKETRNFSTENAGGSTSQAANILEALEAGAELLLVDEDTSATNFMIRDERMQELVAKAQEPITPFLDKVRQLYAEHGVSTILVMGGSGDYFDVADRVIQMEAYRPLDVTDRARAIREKQPLRRLHEGGDRFGPMPARAPLASSFDPSRGRREVKIDAKGLRSLLFGRLMIDLGAVEQLVDDSQTRAIGEAIHYLAMRCFSRELTLREALDTLDRELEDKGLDILAPYPAGDLAMPRRFEIAAAINRMRSLKIAMSNEQ
ncbi:MAG: ABC-ATPase domain-containing protein [Nitrospirae bacterium]|nr:ABC-ATPase domain-containing protein [Nitrospirota bacterium]